MSLSATQPLVSNHQYALKICLQNLKHLQKTFDELESVKTTLETLPNKTRHDTLVPFGVSNPSTPPLMLMEGTIVHTNELLVLLGDNWFVERSAKETIDIMSRRQGKIKAFIDKFNAEKVQHENWLKMINSLYGEDGGFYEINEKCDEEEEKQWREAHRQKVREHKRREAEQRVKMNISHEEMMKRLDRIEVSESEPLKSSLKSTNPKASTKNVKFNESVKNLKMDEDERREEDGVREKVHSEDGRVEKAVEVVGKVNERENNALVRDPSHKDQPVFEQPRKVSQFKLARQSKK